MNELSQAEMVQFNKFLKEFNKLPKLNTIKNQFVFLQKSSTKEQYKRAKIKNSFQKLLFWVFFLNFRKSYCFEIANPPMKTDSLQILGIL